MSTTDKPFGNFETKLLAELRAEAAARGSASAPVAAARRITRRRVVLATSTAAVAALAVAVPVMLGEQASIQAQAFAVERHGDGTVDVRVREFKDPKGLESKLRKMGVPAVVDYAPLGRMCREPRGKAIDADGVFVQPPEEERVPAGDLFFRVRPDRIKPGQTVLLSRTGPLEVKRDYRDEQKLTIMLNSGKYRPFMAMQSGDRTMTAHARVVAGPVAPCTLVSAKDDPAASFSSGH